LPSSPAANGSRVIRDLLIIGKTVTGRSWLACALCQKACRYDRSVVYYCVPRLLDTLALARGEGGYARLLKSLARVELLVDDWGIAPLTSQQGRDLLDIVAAQAVSERGHHLLGIVLGQRLARVHGILRKPPPFAPRD
jgi:DNA replication protein DnaC